MSSQEIFQVLDFLLTPVEDAGCKEEMYKMMLWRDRKGRNALESFIQYDNMDLARRFLDHHLTSTGNNR